MRSPRAFTLMELLVTVGIMAVMMASLLPALSGAKTSAKAAICSSNLRQVAVADSQFQIDNNNSPAQSVRYVGGSSNSALDQYGYKGWHYNITEYLTGSLGYTHQTPTGSQVAWSDGWTNRKDLNNPMSVRSQAIAAGVTCPEVDPAEVTGGSIGPNEAVGTWKKAKYDTDGILRTLKGSISTSHIVLAGDTNGRGIGFRHDPGAYGQPNFRHHAGTPPTENVEHGGWNGSELNNPPFYRGDGQAHLAFYDSSIRTVEPSEFDIELGNTIRVNHAFNLP